MGCKLEAPPAGPMPKVGARPNLKLADVVMAGAGAKIRRKMG
jgi:hypothetical protein